MIEIRPMEVKDFCVARDLLEELGYPFSQDALDIRLNQIIRDDNYETLMAEYDGKVVGMAGLLKNINYEYDGTSVRILIFVVDDTYQGKGIGQALYTACEGWAKKEGAIQILVNSGDREERKRAHAFYKKSGFNQTCLGFRKPLIKSA